MKCGVKTTTCMARSGDECMEHLFTDTPSCPSRISLTNADRIRVMGDEEMANFLILSPEMEFEVCCYCKYGNTLPDDRGQCLTPRGRCFAQDRCDAFKIWLRQPLKEDKP